MAIGFYICIHRAGKTGWLAGPFPTHDQASSERDRVEREAEEIDPRAAFDAFSIGRLEAQSLPAGVLNKRLNI